MRFIFVIIKFLRNMAIEKLSSLFVENIFKCVYIFKVNWSFIFCDNWFIFYKVIFRFYKNGSKPCILKYNIFDIFFNSASTQMKFFTDLSPLLEI